MFQYSNPNYLSKVNDFGDDYHKPDREVVGIDLELVKRIRSMKKRYRDFKEWCAAKRDYEEYAIWLIEKYGGKKRFKTMYRLGMVNDYIPFCPELRKIKKNRKYYKDGMDLEQEGDIEWDVPVYTDTNPIPDYAVPVFKIANTKEGEALYKLIPEDTIKQQLADNLKVIGEYFKGKVKNGSSLSHRAQRMQILEDRYRGKTQKSMWQRWKQYQEDIYFDDYPEERIDPKSYTFYKDTTLSMKDWAEVEVYQALKKIGLRMTSRKLSKDARKVVRRSDPTKLGKGKKKGKKNKKALKDKFVRDFTGEKYDTFSEFEREVLTLTHKMMEEDE